MRHGISILYTTINTQMRKKYCFPKKINLCNCKYLWIAKWHILNSRGWKERGKDWWCLYLSCDRASANIYNLQNLHHHFYSLFRLHILKVWWQTVHWFWNQASVGHFYTPLLFTVHIFFMRFEANYGHCICMDN